MKIIKTSLKFVAVLLLVFFSTGVFIKEISYQVAIEINKPLEEVFTAFNDQSRLKEWMPEMRSIEVIDAKAGVVGSVYKLHVENDGKTIEMNEKVLAYIPNKKVTYYFQIDDMLKTDDFNFVEKNGVIILTQKVLCKTNSYFIQCMFPYFKGKFVEIDQKKLDNFKAYIEK